MIRRNVVLVIVAGSLFSAYFAGYLTRDRDWFPNQQIQGAKTALKSLLPPKSESERMEKSIWSGLLPLHLSWSPVPLDREGAGGGLTSVGDEILLLTHEGTVYEVSGSEPRRTGITPPPNHFDAYREASQTKFKHLAHAPGTFRYNDILFYSQRDRAGIAVAYTEWLSDKDCYVSSLAHAAVDPQTDTVSDLETAPLRWDVVFRTKPCLPLKDVYLALEGIMAGGRLAFLAPNKILLTSGDYHWDGMKAPKILAQSRENDYGKILEINLDSGEAIQVSIGHRNPQGILIDKTGRIWSVEHGPKGGDELNLIQRGSNYGWPEATLGTRYNRLPVPTATQYGRHDDFEAPMYAWIPSVGISNIAQVDNFDPSWDGDLLVGSMKGESLFRLRLRDNRVLFAEPIRIGKRIRYVHQHTDGRIVMWTDSGDLMFLSKDEHTPTDLFVDNFIQNLTLENHQERTFRTAVSECLQCHYLAPNDHAGAPSLATVFGGTVAGTSYDGYSKALRGKGGKWTSEELKSFLSDPARYAPGTTMPNPDLSEETIDDIVLLLDGLAGERREHDR